MNALYEPVTGISLSAALASGLIAGVFFAFSSFVMKALAKLPPGEGIAAMQSINVFAVKSWFLPVFLGSAALSLVAAIWALRHGPHPSSPWMLAAAVLYLAGCFGVTMAFNVPMNNGLAALAPDASTRAAFWADYQIRWTRWNHVRTLAALAASAGFICARNVAS